MTMKDLSQNDKTDSFWVELEYLVYKQLGLEAKFSEQRSFEESQRLNKRLTELYVKHNTAGKGFDELFGDMKFDTFLSAQEAVDYGLADKVITKRDA